MQFLYKTPGYILLLFGGFCLSWGGFIIRSFEEASASNTGVPAPHKEQKRRVSETNFQPFKKQRCL